MTLARSLIRDLGVARRLALQDLALLARVRVYSPVGRAPPRHGVATCDRDRRLQEVVLADDDPIDLMSRLMFRAHPDMVRAAWVRGRALEGPGGRS